MFYATTNLIKNTVSSHSAEPTNELQFSSFAPSNVGDTNVIDVFDAWSCGDCNTICEESAGPLYQCGNCQIEFNRDSSSDGSSHRCPDCNKFSARIADNSCPDCSVCEVYSIKAIECPKCEETVDFAMWEEHCAGCHAEPVA